MSESDAGARTLATRLVETLYTEAMLLADEARAYFDGLGAAGSTALSPAAQVGVACESLKLTTRLMQVIAWLLAQRALAAGERPAGAAEPLGDGVESDPETIAQMPEAAQALVRQSIELHARAARLGGGNIVPLPAASPARSLLHRLQRSL